MGEIQVKTIMITGVSRGLGRVLSLELARRGHNVVGCARSQEKLQGLLTELTRDDPASSSSSSSKHLLKHLDVVSTLSIFLITYSNPSSAVYFDTPSCSFKPILYFECNIIKAC